MVFSSFTYLWSFQYYSSLQIVFIDTSTILVFSFYTFLYSFESCLVLANMTNILQQQLLWWFLAVWLISFCSRNMSTKILRLSITSDISAQPTRLVICFSQNYDLLWFYSLFKCRNHQWRDVNVQPELTIEIQWIQKNICSLT